MHLCHLAVSPAAIWLLHIGMEFKISSPVFIYKQMIVDDTCRGSVIYLKKSPKEVVFCIICLSFQSFFNCHRSGNIATYSFSHICLLFAKGDLWTFFPSVVVSVCAS